MIVNGHESNPETFLPLCVLLAKVAQNLRETLVRYVNLFVTVAALIGFVQPAAADDERFYLDFDLPGSIQGSAGLGLEPYHRIGNTGDQLDGVGLSLGYSLPHETGEWRISAGLSRQSAFGFDATPERQALGLYDDRRTGDDTTAMVSMLYNFDIGNEGLFGLNLRPFVGGGIGLTHSETSEGTADSPGAGLAGEDSAQDDYNLSWGLTAGVNMPLTTNLNLSLSYRYLGQGESERAADARDLNDSENGPHSHDLMLIFGVNF